MITANCNQLSFEYGLDMIQLSKSLRVYFNSL